MNEVARDSRRTPRLYYACDEVMWCVSVILCINHFVNFGCWSALYAAQPIYLFDSSLLSCTTCKFNILILHSTNWPTFCAHSTEFIAVVLKSKSNKIKFRIELRRHLNFTATFFRLFEITSYVWLTEWQTHSRAHTCRRRVPFYTPIKFHMSL